MQSIIIFFIQIITTHKNADFDALASVIAAKMLYPGSIPILPRSLNPNVKAFLSIHKDPLQVNTVGDIDMNDISRPIVVDLNSWERLDQMQSLRTKKDLEIVLWNHHNNEGNIHTDVRHQEEIGATTTLLVMRLKKERKILIIGIITRSDAMLYFYDLLPD